MARTENDRVRLRKIRTRERWFHRKIAEHPDVFADWKWSDHDWKHLPLRKALKRVNGRYNHYMQRLNKKNREQGGGEPSKRQKP